MRKFGDILLFLTFYRALAWPKQLHISCLNLCKAVSTRDRTRSKCGLDTRIDPHVDRFHRDLIEAVLDETDFIQTDSPLAQC